MSDMLTEAIQVLDEIDNRYVGRPYQATPDDIYRYREAMNVFEHEIPRRALKGKPEAIAALHFLAYVEYLEYDKSQTTDEYPNPDCSVVPESQWVDDELLEVLSPGSKPSKTELAIDEFLKADLAKGRLCARDAYDHLFAEGLLDIKA